jgi:hypothetical protein
LAESVERGANIDRSISGSSPPHPAGSWIFESAADRSMEPAKKPELLAQAERGLLAEAERLAIRHPGALRLIA